MTGSGAVALWLAAAQASAPAASQTPAAGQGRWFKGNLHTHSLWSDGDDFPEMIADWYKRKGYHFLALSDHNVLSEGQRWVEVEKRDVALKKYRARFGATWVEEREANGCVVLGDPAYYGRFGFRPDPLLTLPDAPEGAFQALRFTDAASAGEVVLHPGFGHHENDWMAGP